MSSGYRMDKYLRPLKLFRRRPIAPLYKKIMIFFHKEKRDDFLCYGVYLHYYAYITAISGVLLVVIAAILGDPNFTFVAAVIMFVFLALDTLMICFEIVMLTFFDKKTLGD